MVAAAAVLIVPVVRLPVVPPLPKSFQRVPLWAANFRLVVLVAPVIIFTVFAIILRVAISKDREIIENAEGLNKSRRTKENFRLAAFSKC